MVGTSDKLVKTKGKLCDERDPKSRRGSDIACLTETDAKIRRVSSVRFSNKQEFDVILEAKKHLSARFKNLNGVETVTSEKTLKTLGRILSSPEHDFWPVSPRRDGQRISDSAQMRFSPYNTSHRVTESSSKISNGRERACLSPLSSNTEVTSCDDTDISATNDMKSNGEPKIVEMDRIIRPQLHTSEVPNEINSIDNSFSENEALSSTVDEFPSTPLSIDQLDGADSIKNQEEHRSPFLSSSHFTQKMLTVHQASRQTDGQKLKPLRLVFEECIQEQDHLSQYVHSVLQASCLNWDQLSRIKFPPEELLDASLFDEVEFLLIDCYFDPKLLFDRINEVLLEIYRFHFCSPPWPAFAKPKIGSMPLAELVLDEIMTEADFYLLPRTEKRTLDQLVSKDVADCRSWLDVRLDTERIVTEISEDFVEESILDILVILLEFPPPLMADFSSCPPESQTPKLGSYANVTASNSNRSNLPFDPKKVVPVGTHQVIDGKQVLGFSTSENDRLAASWKLTLIGKFSFAIPHPKGIDSGFSALNLKGPFSWSFANPSHIIIKLQLEEDFNKLWMGTLWYAASSGLPNKDPVLDYLWHEFVLNRLIEGEN
ncbi:hypothetical protein DH2020_005518 [Rehmannia glutinosa]|uniref:DUF4378 domain-containing protein n=1 Tax=Rehmannia glutinosa TaxID=99300 RepID=A0ABR0XG94_REHGL